MKIKYAENQTTVEKASQSPLDTKKIKKSKEKEDLHLEKVLSNLLFVMTETKSPNSSEEDGKMVSTFSALKDGICRTIDSGKEDLKVELVMMKLEDLDKGQIKKSKKSKGMLIEILDFLTIIPEFSDSKCRQIWL